MIGFVEAKKRLKKLADGEYHSLKYEIVDFENGTIEQRCSVYIHTRNIHTESTWEIALEKMENEINPPDPIDVVIEDIKVIE